MKTANTHCDKIRELILLEESGELSQDSSTELNLHLKECRACAQYRREIRTIINCGRNALPGGLPSEQTVNNIIARAGEQSGEIVFFAHPWRIAAGIAAVLAVILSTYLAVYTPETQSGNTAFETGDLHLMISLATEGELEMPFMDSTGSDEAQLKELAGRLLKLQGFSLEESEEPEDITDLFLPTVLQLHNTPGSPSETSV